MIAVYSYIDFLIKTFDVRSKTSRKCYWTVFLINAVLSVLLTSVGLALPQGRPLEVYIGISSVIAAPLFISFFTIAARRLADAGFSRKWMLFFLLPGIGLIPLFAFCAFRSKYQTEEDYSSYRNGTFLQAAKKLTASALTIFPFVYLVYCIYKLTTAADSIETGINAAMLSLTFMICILTVIEAKTAKLKKLLDAWKILKLLTALSGATLSIILYHDSQNFIDALFTVYLYFYIMIAPCIIVWDICKLFRKAG